MEWANRHTARDPAAARGLVEAGSSGVAGAEEGGPWIRSEVAVCLDDSGPLGEE